MTSTLILDPLIPMVALLVLAGFAAVLIGFGAWRRLSGWWLRALAAIAVLAALGNPSILQEDRAPLSDIVIAVIDQSASQVISDRTAQTQTALDNLRSEIARRDNTELREVTVGDGEGDAGTELMTAPVRRPVRRTPSTGRRHRDDHGWTVARHRAHTHPARTDPRNFDGPQHRLGSPAHRVQRTCLCNFGRNSHPDP